MNALTQEKQKLLNQQIVMSLLSYDKDTGTFIWIIKGRYNHRTGCVAGYLNTDGYQYIKYKDKNFKAHRLAWLYVYGEWPNGHIDHVNGTRNDNRISNLRVVSYRENNLNQKMHREGRLPGCFYEKRWKRWQSNIQLNGQHLYLGLFDTEQEASNAYFTYKKEHSL